MTAPRAISGVLLASILASLGLLVVYALGGQPQIEGILLFVALGGLGAALVVWAAALLDVAVEVEERHPLRSPEPERRAAAGAMRAGEMGRRRFLVRLVAGASAALLAALAVPALSLGPQPGGALFRTAWRPGSRLVTSDGEPLRVDDVALDSVRTVYPEGAVGAPDAQTLLIRVRAGDLALPDGRARWAPEGCVAYSKICTHAGCPVGLYRAEDHALLCPCHQSTFDVLRGAVPTFGPAARPLPQLALELDDGGYLVAQGDFAEPVGPSFWNMTHDPDEDA